MVLLQSRTHYYHQGRDGKCDTGHTTAFFAIVPQITASSQAGHVARTRSSWPRNHPNEIGGVGGGSVPHPREPWRGGQHLALLDVHEGQRLAGRIRRQRRRRPPDARGGRLGSAATSTGFTVDLWKEGRAHPTYPLGGISPRGAARARRRILGGLRAGGDFARRIYLGLPLPHPDFQQPTRELHHGIGPAPGTTRSLPPASAVMSFQDLVREPAPSPSADPLLGIHHEVDGFLALSFHPPRREGLENHPHEIGGVRGRSAALCPRPMRTSASQACRPVVSAAAPRTEAARASQRSRRGPRGRRCLPYAKSRSPRRWPSRESSSRHGVALLRGWMSAPPMQACFSPHKLHVTQTPLIRPPRNRPRPDRARPGVLLPQRPEQWSAARAPGVRCSRGSAPRPPK